MKKILQEDFWKGVYESGINWAIAHVPSIIIIFLLLFIALKVYRFAIKKLGKTLTDNNQKDNSDEPDIEKEKRINTLMNIVRQAGVILIWMIFIMILLGQFNINIGPLIASAGIIGLALGFGAQELVRDFITGFFILLENQVRTGDVAIINGTGGLVETIELRTITLRDLSGTVHIFQNGKINTLSNMTKEWSAMVFDVGVAYKEDVDRVIKVMKDVADDLCADEEFKEFILEPIEIFGLDKFGDSAVIVKARIKTQPIKQWMVGREYNKRLKVAFDREQIEIPFPHRTIYWGEEISPLRLNVDDERKAT